MIPNRCGFYDGVLAYVDVITNFHGVVVEVSSIGFVWRPAQKRKFEDRLSYDVLRVTHLITQPSPIRQYLPKEMTTACPGPVRRKSPRIIAPLEIIVFPPRMIFCGPAIVARRDTLFPVSCSALSKHSLHVVCNH